jgi:hypothetical protein
MPLVKAAGIRWAVSLEYQGMADTLWHLGVRAGARPKVSE